MSLAPLGSKEIPENRVFLVHRVLLECLVKRVPLEKQVCPDFQGQMVLRVTQEEKDHQERKGFLVPLEPRVRLATPELVELRVPMESEASKETKVKRVKMASQGSKVTWGRKETEATSE